MKTNKLRQIISFEKLPKDVQQQIKDTYPQGYLEHLIQFSDNKGNLIKALPFETDDRYYLVKIGVQKTKELILEYEDIYGTESLLKEANKFDFEAELEEED